MAVGPRGVLADFFAESDVDGTGVLSAAELEGALRQLPCCALDTLSPADLAAVVGARSTAPSFPHTYVTAPPRPRLPPSLFHPLSLSLAKASLLAVR